MKKQSVLLAGVVSLAFCGWAAAYSGGTGEPNDPYIIATAGDMNEIGTHSSDWNKHFLLVADIDLAAYTGTQFNIIGNCANNFTGAFDGNGHKVYNFKWSSSEAYEIGLFGHLGSGGQIKNLGVENVDVNVVEEIVYLDYYNYVGALVGWNSGGTINNCYMTGNVRAAGYYDYYEGLLSSFIVGGLVGRNDGTIIDSYSMANVLGSSNVTAYVGGLAGYNQYGSITNCYFIGSVNGTGDSIVVGGLVGKNDNGSINGCNFMGGVSGYDFVGGLVGCNYRGPISDCNATGGVEGNWCVGGLTGDNSYSTISNCLSTGGASGNEDVGGMVGWNAVGTISNCYSTETVDGNNNIGGLVGRSGFHTTISKCYSTGNVSGESGVGGLVGNGSVGYVAASFWDIQTSGRANSDGGEGKTTVEMQDINTFLDAGWDFICETENGTDDLWTIDDGVDYPKLVWDAGCFPVGHEDYDEWLAAGKPPCWCCSRQCHGNVDNTSEHIKGKGYYHVHFKDLNVLLTAWNTKEPPDGPGLVWPDPNICADIDHRIEGDTDTGYWRVHFNDLDILLDYWNVREPPDGSGVPPDCLD